MPAMSTWRRRQRFKSTQASEFHPANRSLLFHGQGVACAWEQYSASNEWCAKPVSRNGAKKRQNLIGVEQADEKKAHPFRRQRRLTSHPWALLSGGPCKFYSRQREREHKQPAGLSSERETPTRQAKQKHTNKMFCWGSLS